MLKTILDTWKICFLKFSKEKPLKNSWNMLIKDIFLYRKIEDV